MLGKFKDFKGVDEARDMRKRYAKKFSERK